MGAIPYSSNDMGIPWPCRSLNLPDKGYVRSDDSQRGEITLKRQCTVHTYTYCYTQGSRSTRCRENQALVQKERLSRMASRGEKQAFTGRAERLKLGTVYESGCVLVALTAPSLALQHASSNAQVCMRETRRKEEKNPAVPRLSKGGTGDKRENRI
jgi:hypothetical protein